MGGPRRNASPPPAAPGSVAFSRRTRYRVAQRTPGATTLGWADDARGLDTGCPVRCTPDSIEPGCCRSAPTPPGFLVACTPRLGSRGQRRGEATGNNLQLGPPHSRHTPSGPCIAEAQGRTHAWRCQACCWAGCGPIIGVAVKGLHLHQATSPQSPATCSHALRLPSWPEVVPRQ